jgi:choline transporter-like protein 2/4/5
MDYAGNICGIDDVTTTLGTNIKDMSKAFYLPSGAPVCVKECPTEDNYEEFICKYDIQAELEALTSAPEILSKAAQYTAKMYCAPKIETVDAWGYCVPQAAIDALANAAAAAFNNKVNEECMSDDSSLVRVTGNENEYTDTLDTDKYWSTDTTPFDCVAAQNGTVVSAEYLDPQTEDGFFDQANADMYTASNVIIGCGSGVALVLGFVYLYILRIPGVLSLVCWSLISAIEACFLGCGFLAYSNSQAWNPTLEGNEDSQYSETEAQLMMYVAYLFAGLGAIWFCVICCLRKRIILAIGIVKEACKAVARMPIITVYPVFQVIGVVLFLIPWCTYMVYLASSGDVKVDCICPPSMSSGFDPTSFASSSSDEEATKNCEDSGCFMYKSFAYDNNTKLVGLYMLFSWFWTSQFIIAAGQIVVAMSVSMWYFTRDKSTIGNGTFFTAMKKAMYYHLGTAAFGSLIIAIIKTIRVVITYLQNKFKNSKNQLIKIVLCAIQCYMWCLEKCMKFLNKNAYIQTAIFGYSFCTAARKAFFLILRNILRISAVAIVSEFVLIIGKLFITISATFLGYYYMNSNMMDELNGLWCPLLLIILMAYVTSEMFNEVFGMAIWTILQCFVADEEMFENAAERFAEGDLAETVSKTQKEAGASAVTPQMDGVAPQSSGTEMP